LIVEDIRVSIGQVKRDISDLVNRVAYGGERVVLTSRGKPKAAIVSMDDYERLIAVDTDDTMNRLETWLQASDELAARVAAKGVGKPFDADSVIAAAAADLEERHEFLRDH
jgi:prevent-host-death family protein